MNSNGMSVYGSMQGFTRWMVPIFCSLGSFFLSSNTASAQEDSTKFRMAKIEVYPEYLEAYKTALKEHAEAAVRLEPGVLALQAMFDKVHPSSVTVFEVYASEEAYLKHLKAPHFLKYKAGTMKMVKSLELVELGPIAIQLKPELWRKKTQQ